jgi:Dynamin family
MTDPGHAAAGLDTLDSLARAADALDHPALASEARDLAERVAAGRVLVAVVGQFKRGKSTLVNALVGGTVLPTGVVPVTSVLTVIRYGAVPAASVTFASGEQVEVPPAEIAGFVTERENPGNRRNVRLVEIALPSDVLAEGLCLVDTPGLGSTSMVTAEETRRFVPQLDAALVVIGADPPVSGDEAALVGAIAEQTGALLFVLNKADRVAAADRLEAAAFAARVLEPRLGRPVGRVYEISATERLAGEPTRDWPALEQAIAGLARDRRRLLDDRAARRSAVLRASLLNELAVQREALRRPLDQTAARLAALEAAAAASERALHDLGPVMTAERGALVRAFDAACRQFLVEARASSRSELNRRLPAPSGPVLTRARAFEAAQAVARERVTAWRQPLEARAGELYAETMRRFVELGDDLLVRLGSGSAGGGPPVVAARLSLDESKQRFQSARAFHFTDMMALTGTGPVDWLLDRLLPAGVRRGAVRRAADRYLDRLLETNAARFANDLAARVDVARAALEAGIRATLSDAVARAAHALDHARRAHADGQEAVDRALARLESIESVLRA